MIDTDHSSADIGAAQVIYRQVCAALVFVLEPSEAFGFARLLVPRELQEDGLAELRENGDDVAFSQVVGQAAEINKCRVAVVDVP